MIDMFSCTSPVKKQGSVSAWICKYILPLINMGTTADDPLRFCLVVSTYHWLLMIIVSSTHRIMRVIINLSRKMQKSSELISPALCCCGWCFINSLAGTPVVVWVQFLDGDGLKWIKWMNWGTSRYSNNNNNNDNRKCNGSFLLSSFKFAKRITYCLPGQWPPSSSVSPKTLMSYDECKSGVVKAPEF